MGLIHRVLRRFRPPSVEDPTFGRLLYMHIPRDPTLSYWEGEWEFPPTGTRIAIGLPGGEEGPSPEARAFYEALPARFEGILEWVRPGLDGVFRQWIGRPISDSLWDDVKLAGFGLEDPTVSSVEWDVAFEAIGDTWLGITVPFVGDTPQEPVVDT